MITLDLCQTQRWLKSVLALSIGLFGVLVASSNLLDYDSNWQFVQHVLSMDTMQPWFKGESLKDRAITDAMVQQMIYIGIITGEGIFGILCAIGGIHMLLGTIKNSSSIFLKGKAWFTLGCIFAIVIWYTSFAVIASEYFVMWANQWNGQTKAYTFITFILLSLFYISQAEAVALEQGN